MMVKRPLALFDLDGTLVDRRAAFAAWADAHHTGPMGSFFATVRQTFDLAEPPGTLWAQYRRRMPGLVSCRQQDLRALRRLREAGWRILIGPGRGRQAAH